MAAKDRVEIASHVIRFSNAFDRVSDDGMASNEEQKFVKMHRREKDSSSKFCVMM